MRGAPMMTQWSAPPIWSILYFAKNKAVAEATTQGGATMPAWVRRTQQKHTYL